MGVLRALGFSRRQVSRAVSAHGTTIGVVAVVVGVPLGLAVGRWVWVTHASHIGLSTAISAPVAPVVAVAIATIVLTWLIATAAGHRASRARPTNALHVE
jgi:ABC-type lipoprotein release transport system permease subunit